MPVHSVLGWCHRSLGKFLLEGTAKAFWGLPVSRGSALVNVSSRNALGHLPLPAQQWTLPLPRPGLPTLLRALRFLRSVSCALGRALVCP